jgi:hypothetical protein
MLQLHLLHPQHQQHLPNLNNHLFKKKKQLQFQLLQKNQQLNKRKKLQLQLLQQPLLLQQNQLNKKSKHQSLPQLLPQSPPQLLKPQKLLQFK